MLRGCGSRGARIGLGPPLRQFFSDAGLLPRVRREDLAGVSVSWPELACPDEQPVALGEVDLVGRLPPTLNGS